MQSAVWQMAPTRRSARDVLAGAPQFSRMLRDIGEVARRLWRGWTVLLTIDSAVALVAIYRFAGGTVAASVGVPFRLASSTGTVRAHPVRIAS